MQRGFVRGQLSFVSLKRKTVAAVDKFEDILQEVRALGVRCCYLAVHLP